MTPIKNHLIKTKIVTEYFLRHKVKTIVSMLRKQMENKSIIQLNILGKNTKKVRIPKKKEYQKKKRKKVKKVLKGIRCILSKQATKEAERS